MKLSDKLLDEIKKEIELGYINRVKHPELDLWILNYSNAATYDWRWNDATRMCRGLIVDNNYSVINRSYPKFFDIEQIENTACDDIWQNHDTEYYTVAHKKDGFLGCMYVDKHLSNQLIHSDYKMNSKYMAIATRGSFSSEMAIRATEILRTKYKNINWDTRYSYSFEIIYPNDILTIHYGYEDIILHGVFDNETGDEIPIHKFKDWEYLKKMGLTMEEPVEMGSHFKGIEDFYKTYKFNDDEGYVIKFESGYKIKVKFDEYKKMSAAKRSLSELYSKGFIEKVIDGTVDKIMKDNPMLHNEHRDKAIKDVITEYNNLASLIKMRNADIYSRFGGDCSDKTFAIESKSDYPNDYVDMMLLRKGKKDKLQRHIIKMVYNNIGTKSDNVE